MKLSPEQIERLRQTGVRLDREGRFWHEGEVVAHQGFHKALLRWLDVLEDGRPILRLDDTRYAYVDVDDAFLLVTSARWEEGRLFVHLNDDSEEELAYDSLSVGDNDALYCLVRNGKLRARVTTKAYYVFADGLEEEEGSFFFRAAGQRFAIAKEPGAD